MIPNYRTAIVKWNGGRGALLCNRCRTIIREGFEHADIEHFRKEIGGKGSGETK